MVISVTILAIVMLANDMRNLRASLRHYEIEWPFSVAQALPMPQAVRGRRLKGSPIQLPSRFVDNALDADRSAFVRAIDIGGPALCEALRQAGIANDGWQPGQFDRTAYECFSETVLPTADAGERNASFFFMAKGTQQGVLDSIRMKLVVPQTEEGKTVQAIFHKALTLLMLQNQWSALEPAAGHAQRLEDFATTGFGLAFKFSREFNAQHRFNLLISVSDKDPAVARTRAFFEADGWMLLPAGLRHWRATNLARTRRISVGDVGARAVVELPTQ